MYTSCLPAITRRCSSLSPFPCQHFTHRTMPPRSKKKPGLLSRFASLLNGRSGRSTVESHHSSAEPANAGPERLPTHSGLHLLHSESEGSSVLQCHESQRPIRLSSENEIVDSSQHSALSIAASKQRPLQPPQRFPALQSYDIDDQLASGAHSGTTSLFQGASKFQTGDFHVHVGDKSLDGASLH
jgi:hypothetical protein